MTTDADLIKALQAQAEKGGIDPALKEQIELSLDGAYRFNAETAKFDIVWVWLVRLPMIGCAIGALYAFMMTLALGLGQQEIHLFDIGARRSNHLVSAFPDQWSIYLGVSLACLIGFIFFAYMTKAMRISHETSIKMANAHEKKQAEAL